MPRRAFADRIGTSPKSAAVSIVLVADAFIWYFYGARFLTEIINGGGFSDPAVLVVWGINILGIAASALFGVFIIYHVFKKRVSFLLYWMLAGIILSLIPLAVDITEFNALMIFSTLVGVYFGLGMPISLGYYAASTEAGNRSRLGGIIFLLIFAGVFLLKSLGITDVAPNAIILAVCKAVGLVIIVSMKPDEKQIAQSDRVSYGFVFKNRPFLLYFIPWVMFSIVNYMTGPIVSQFFPEGFFQYSTMIENILAGIFAVICGFFGDYIGRKRLVVAGFTLLGLGYASLGLFQENIFGWWFYTAVDGIAWGAFYTIFIMTIWGDVAQEKSSEKYYAIGSLPFLFSVFMQLSIGTYISSMVSKSAVFSFASFFLFLAVLPVVYAPETLPEKNIKDRELKSYIEKAKRARSTFQQ